MERLKSFKGKRGAAHFEMIVSFVLFFLFVTFLLVFVRPTGTSTLSASVIAGLHDSFREQAETNYTKFFMKASSEEDCFYVQLDGDLFAYAFSESIVEEVVEGIKGSELRPGGVLSVEDGGGSYYVYLSPKFEVGSFDCVHLASGFELGSIDEKKVISYEELEALKIRYDSDYNGLKSEMNLPATYDFAIVSDLITIEGVVPTQGDILAEDYIEEVLFNNGTLINQRFTLKVWS
jgi:hypothetical protein